MEHKIRVFTDQRALKFLSSCTENSSRIARWFEFMQKFDLKIEYIRGNQNIIADALSKSFTETQIKAQQNKTKYIALINSPRDRQDISQWANLIRKAQQRSKELQNEVLRYPDRYKERHGIIRVWTIVGERIPIPNGLAWELINLVHRYLLHFGTEKILSFVYRYFYIKNVDKLVRDVVTSCHVCLTTKYYTKATVGQYYYEIPRKPKKTVLMDLCGSLPQTPRRNKYILVLSDHFFKTS